MNYYLIKRICCNQRKQLALKILRFQNGFLFAEQDMSKEDKKNAEYFTKQKEKDERRAVALRLNLKRRKNQVRKRIGKEDD